VVKPLDGELISDAAAYDLVITVEDGLREGGVGSALSDAVVSHAVESDLAVPLVWSLGVPAEFLPHGKPDEILRSLGLDAEGIADQVRRLRKRRR
jgi:1-deoxy-D-xylulose-5-phosphate synthase